MFLFLAFLEGIEWQQLTSCNARSQKIISIRKRAIKETEIILDRSLY
jgi:hypothetical protein